MSRPAGEPLTRISINLLTADYETLQELHPAGYQLKIRELVHAYCEENRMMQQSLQYMVPENER